MDGPEVGRVGDEQLEAEAVELRQAEKIVGVLCDLGGAVRRRGREVEGSARLPCTTLLLVMKEQRLTAPPAASSRMHFALASGSLSNGRPIVPSESV
jgi:hypothetical protein